MEQRPPADRSLLGVAVEYVLSDGPMRVPEQRARAAESALELIAAWEGRMEPDTSGGRADVRDAYLMAVADVCRINPTTLRHRLVELMDGRSATSGDFPVAFGVCRYCGEQIRQMRYVDADCEAWHHASDDAVCCCDDGGYHIAAPRDEEGE